MKVSKHCTTSSKTVSCMNFLVCKELTAIYCFASPVHVGLLQCYFTFGSSVTLTYTQASLPFCHSQYTVESNTEIWFSATHLSFSGNLEDLWSMWSLLKKEKTYLRTGCYGDPWICSSSFLLVCTDTYTGVSTKATLTHDHHHQWHPLLVHLPIINKTRHRHMHYVSHIMTQFLTVWVSF